MQGPRQGSWHPAGVHLEHGCNSYTHQTCDCGWTTKQFMQPQALVLAPLFVNHTNLSTRLQQNCMSFHFLNWITHWIFRQSPSVFCSRSCNWLLESECVNRIDEKDNFATHSGLYEFTDMPLIVQCPYYITLQGLPETFQARLEGMPAQCTLMPQLQWELRMFKEHLQSLVTTVFECLHG